MVAGRSPRRSSRRPTRRRWTRPTRRRRRWPATSLEVIDDRRRHPGDDLLSQLIAVEEAGDRLTPAELLVVRDAAVRRRPRDDRQPDRQRDARAAAPSRRAARAGATTRPLGATAVDELLRFDGPVQLTVRVPLVPVRFGDVEVDPGHGRDARCSAPPTTTRRCSPTRTRCGSTARTRPPPRLLGRHPLLPRRVAGPARGRRRHRLADPPVPRRSSCSASRHWRDRLTIRGVDRLPLTTPLTPPPPSFPVVVRALHEGCAEV